MYKPHKLQKSALIRIEALAKAAQKEFLAGNTKLADRYVFLSRKIAMKVRMPLPSSFRRQICKSCKSYLMASKNCTVRLNKGILVTRCHKCNTISRYVYNRKNSKVVRKQTQTNKKTQ